MELNADAILKAAVLDGLRDGIKAKLSNGYSNPLDKLVEQCIQANSDEFRKLLNDSLSSCINDRVFREDIKTSVRATLAKTLVQRFGGELEKQVNVLKSDPATRARITLAIEQIVKERCEAAPS